ncbi:siderophore ABC transporter substrate-binding protein [Paeniglutamicibacter cryotolerans]|uniref:Iron complex transport system substrate-binding protein n=1 Tax=Paeniglutamicibacter cryotolerans TaxID=670079 RepID=A0A839QFK2_9MICC|nr:ABC transporter substrate-binding protein [Paeniglutamicibacter cryotolerans]MBB2994403.1 iron complex transport system substrate-binding protein [Paeniglutamicibacter cryotolerans]
MKISFRTLLGTVAAGASLIALTACGGSSEPAKAEGKTVSITHAQGTTEVPVNPEKVFTFDLGVLDSMEALGIEADGVPDAQFPESLAKYKDAKFEKIGSMKEPNFEDIAAAAPDLIIITGRTAGSYKQFSEDMKIPTVDLSVDASKPMESFKEQAANLGKIFDAEDKVATALTDIDTKATETKARASNAGKGLIVLTSGGEVTAYSAGSRFGLIHDVLGVATAADVKHDGAHGEAVSFEFIKEKNPDTLYVVDRDGAMGTAGEAADAVLDNELVNSTNAAKNGKIVKLDANSWYMVGYGLNNLPKMIGEVAQAL